MTARTSNNEPIIQVRNVSKQYNVGMDRTYKTISESFTNAIRSPIKSLQRIGYQHDTFWALKDINFEVDQGEVVGIIGRNGAGKSTLLKILSRITTPTEGEIRLRGRIGSLLEVGTGFHPELTGRENIYFNGAILGMKKMEIDDKFDEIVKFSGVDKFLDTPVKRYSSGMKVRLAFSVAAHLEPEILLVDEVLAVGDASFQKKCLGKMGAISEEGKTVIFVSHNMNAISRLCERVILVKNGKVEMDGIATEVINEYMRSVINEEHSFSQPENPDLPICLLEAKVYAEDSKIQSTFPRNKDVVFELKYKVNHLISDIHVYSNIFSIDGNVVFGTSDADLNPERFNERKPGIYKCKFKIPKNLLNDNLYTASFSLGIPYKHNYQENNHILSFRISDIGSEEKYIHQPRSGMIYLDIPWYYEESKL